VTVYEFLDGKLAVRYGLHEVARFEAAPPALQPLRRSRLARPMGHKRHVA
jgi:hypothetical protein